MSEVICNHCGKEESLCRCGEEKAQEEVLKTNIAEELLNQDGFIGNYFIETYKDKPDLVNSYGFCLNDYFAKANKIITILEQLGYRKPAELKLIGDKEIQDALYKAQPEGFDWVSMSESERIKYKVVAQAQLDADRKALNG